MASQVAPQTHEAVEGTPRKRMSPKLKRQIGWRQDWCCLGYQEPCGAPLPFPFHVDHIVPLELGGSDDEGNMQALCLACHAAKTRDDRKRIDKAKRLARDKDPETRRKSPYRMRGRKFRPADELK